MTSIAADPEIGKLRQYRAFPFLMAPAKSHYAIYKPFDKGIVIAKVLHGRQNIEMIVNKMGFKLALEVEEMESRHKNE